MVTGSRNHTNRALIELVLTQHHIQNPIDLLIVGDARGADTIAKQWATANYINVALFIADWKNQGKSAGPKRNQHMIDEKPDLVIAFPLEYGKGTVDAVDRALFEKIPVEWHGRL